MEVIPVEKCAELKILRVGECAQRLGQCFGVDKPLPFPIPVWVADVNCEKEAFAAEVLQLRTADGRQEGNPDYADLRNAGKVSATSLFFRGQGYRSPDKMKFKDQFGEFTQPGQRQY